MLPSSPGTSKLAAPSVRTTASVSPKQSRIRDGLISLEQECRAIRAGVLLDIDRVPSGLIYSAVCDDELGSTVYSPVAALNGKIVHAGGGEQLVSTSGLALSACVTVLDASLRHRAHAIQRSNKYDGVRQSGLGGSSVATIGRTQRVRGSSQRLDGTVSMKGVTGVQGGRVSHKHGQNISNGRRLRTPAAEGPTLDQATRIAFTRARLSQHPGNAVTGLDATLRRAHQRVAGLSGPGKAKRSLIHLNKGRSERGHGTVDVAAVPKGSVQIAAATGPGVSPVQAPGDPSQDSHVPVVDLGRAMYSTSRSLSRSSWQARLSALCGSLLRTEDKLPLAGLFVKCFGMQHGVPYRPRYGEVLLDLLLSFYKQDRIDASFQKAQLSGLLFAAPVHTSDNQYEAGVVPVRVATSAIRYCMQHSPAAALWHLAAAAEAVGLEPECLHWSRESRDALSDDILELVATSSGHGRFDPDGDASIVTRLQAVYRSNAEPTVPMDQVLVLFMRAWSLEASRVEHLVQMQQRLGVESGALAQLQSGLVQGLVRAVENQTQLTDTTTTGVQERAASLGMPRSSRDQDSGTLAQESAKSYSRAATYIRLDRGWMRSSDLSRKVEDSLSLVAMEWLSDALSIPSEEEQARERSRQSGARLCRLRDKRTQSSARAQKNTSPGVTNESRNGPSHALPPHLSHSPNTRAGTAASPIAAHKGRRPATRSPVAASVTAGDPVKEQDSDSDTQAVVPGTDTLRSVQRSVEWLSVGSQTDTRVGDGNTSASGDGSRSGGSAAWPLLEVAAAGAMRQVCSLAVAQLQIEIRDTAVLRSELQERDALVRAQAIMIERLQRELSNRTSHEPSTTLGSPQAETGNRGKPVDAYRATEVNQSKSVIKAGMRTSVAARTSDDRSGSSPLGNHGELGRTSNDRRRGTVVGRAAVGGDIDGSPVAGTRMLDAAMEAVRKAEVAAIGLPRSSRGIGRGRGGRGSDRRYMAGPHVVRIWGSDEDEGAGAGASVRGRGRGREGLEEDGQREEMTSSSRANSHSGNSGAGIMSALQGDDPARDDELLAMAARHCSPL